MNALLDAHQTAARLPWTALAAEIRALLRDDTVRVPARLVQPLPGGASLFVMPAHRRRVGAGGAFTPQMVELGPALRRHSAAQSRVVLDTADAVHEAGDPLQAGPAGTWRRHAPPGPERGPRRAALRARTWPAR